MRKVLLSVAGILFLLNTPTLAAESQEGGLPGGIDYSFSLTGVVQHANRDAIKDDASLSGDFELSGIVGPGRLLLHLEGASTVREGRVAAMLGDANADAGSAADGSGKGRVQLSELHYTVGEEGKRSLTLGLLDTTAFLDGSEVAGDETAQFIGASFVNNPTIAFPDYTLGLAFGHELSETFGYSLVLAGSHGLGDNEKDGAPHPYYRELFDLGQSGKGVFSALELHRKQGETMFRLGAWTSTAAHDFLNGEAKTAWDYGAYGLVDGKIGECGWNLRAGFANADVAPVRGFLAAAVEYPLLERLNLGLGLAYGRAQLGADRDGDGETDARDGVDTWQSELYARYTLLENLHLTPSVQWLRNGGPGSGDRELDDVTVLGLRLYWEIGSK